MTERFQILGVRISAINMSDAVSVVESAIAGRMKIYICVCPVSTIMACSRDANAMESVNRADLVTPDGMPVVWIGRIKGYSGIRRVYGPDLMKAIAALSQKKGYRNYFYGATEHVLGRLGERLCALFPGLQVAGKFAPPFRQLTDAEDAAAVEAINKAEADIVWVGLGSPKQDIWMAEHRERINAPVLIGVGAAFDFVAGTKPQAPRWMQRSGLEWFFRLACEPRRLWQRYLVDNALFLLGLLRQGL